VDFLQSMQLVVNLVWLPRYMYYSGRIFTYKLDRTTVTVGAPRMLAISTSPASADASSSASVAAGSSTAGAALSATGTCGTTSVMVGAGLRFLLASSPTVFQSPSSPWSTGSEGGISCKHSGISCQHMQQLQVKNSPTLLEEHTS
jgi:hypothetical protein